MAHDTVDRPLPKADLLVADFGDGNEGSIGPESDRDVKSINDVADPKYLERFRTERWFCMDDGLEELGGQLPGGIMISEVAGDMMNPRLEPQPLSRTVAQTTKDLIEEGIEVWVHGDNHAGKAGCAANNYMREILAATGRTADVVAPTVWVLLEGLGVTSALQRPMIRQSIDAGAQRAKNDKLWDASAEEVAAIAEKNGAEYHALDRVHKTACTRVDLTPNIFDNRSFRKDHKTAEGDPLGAFSITLGAYRDSLVKRAQKHGYDQAWVAEKVMQAAIFTVGSSKKLGNFKLRLAVIT